MRGDGASLGPNETDLVGRWIRRGNRLVADPVEKRIGQLLADHLQKIAVAPESGGWDILFWDPQDGRYWELTHPHGGMHGGGPKRLTNLCKAAAMAKYRLRNE